MTPFMIIGIIFTALLIGVLVWVLSTGRKFAPVQQTIIIFFEALCAGFASAGFIGDARLQANGKLEGFDVVLTAGGGFAVFIIVGYGMSKLLTSLGKRQGTGISFRWPSESKFQVIVEALVQNRGLVAQFTGFSNEQLTAKLAAGKIEADTLEDALKGLAAQAKLPPVEIKIEKPFCHLAIGG